MICVGYLQNVIEGLDDVKDHLRTDSDIKKIDNFIKYLNGLELY